MHWSTTLYNAADAFDGGARSFPLSSEAAFARKHGYEPPNKEYEKFFSRLASVQRSQRDQEASPRSAGWLIPHPDDNSLCKPVFIAHSMTAAIWFVREMLAEDALSNDGWDSLVCAAQSLAEEGVAEPPSAQKPSASALTQRKKRPAPSAQASPPKRARLETDEGRTASSPSQPVEEPLDDAVEQPEAIITTVTNNNRRAERKRQRNAEAAQVKRSQSLGLVEPDKSASKAEHGAYASLLPSDSSVVSWLFKQHAVDKDKQKTHFYHAVKTPYLRAREFLDKARSLGSLTSQEHAAYFLRCWRENKRLFRGAAIAGSSDEPLSSLFSSSAPLSQQRNSDQAFFSAWRRCNVYEDLIKSLYIEYRWAQALLGKALADKTAQLEREDRLISADKVNRFGRGLRQTEAIDYLLALVHPDAAPSKPQRDAFRARLARAFKWYRIAEGLGWGVLLVMPQDAISNSWIEHKINSWGVDVFINLVCKERPDVCLAAKQFSDWLGPDGIAGGPIDQKETLSIELNASQIAHEVEEIQDSEDDDDSGEDDGRVVVTCLPGRAKSASAAPLRQTTLPELFTVVG